MVKAREVYTPDEKMWVNPYTSPLEADNLSDLPPALVITAQFDPLRDEGELYGEKLNEAGIPVKTVRYNGVMHGFVSFYQVMKSGDTALNQTAAFLSQAEKEDWQKKEQYELVIQDTPEGWGRVKEEVEAFAIAAFLVGKSTLNFFINK